MELNQLKGLAASIMQEMARSNAQHHHPTQLGDDVVRHMMCRNVRQEDRGFVGNYIFAQHGYGGGLVCSGAPFRELNLSKYGNACFELRGSNGETKRIRGLAQGISLIKDLQSKACYGELYLVSDSQVVLLYCQSRRSAEHPSGIQKFECAAFAHLCNIGHIRHPYADLTLAQAIQIAVTSAQLFGRDVPNTLLEVRSYFQQDLDRCGHVWITGMASLDLLDQLIDGKFIKKHSRLI
jgi:hypothetical protein